jgi:hypothetical protein
MKEYLQIIPVIVVFAIAIILLIYIRDAYDKELAARHDTIRRFLAGDAESFISYLDKVGFIDYEKLNYCLKQIEYRGYAVRSDLMDLFSMNLSTFSKDNIKVERMEISEVKRLIVKRYL